MHPEIILEHADWVMINKPAGMLSIPDREGKEPSLKKWTEATVGSAYTVHRLDQFTSGLILFAKHPESQQELSKLFEERKIDKRYLGIVKGTPIHAEDSIDVPIMEHPAKNGKMVTHAKGKAALTTYKVIEAFPWMSLVEFNIHTGRTHQIRVHMQHIGHPIMCDELYGDGQPFLLSSLKKNYKVSLNQEAEIPMLNRQALHAWKLSFTWKGNEISGEATLPKDMRATLQQVRKRSQPSKR